MPANPIFPAFTNTYAGQFAGKYISAALLSAPTIENGGVTVMPNIKFKSVIQRLETASVLENASCDFQQNATVTLTERVLEVKDLQVNMQLCKSQFHDSWLGIEQGFSSFDVLPKSFSDYLIAHVAAQVASANEVSLWQGSGAVSGQFDGLFSTALVDPLLPPAQLIANVVITPANVIAQMQLVDDQIPASLYGKADLKIYVSQNVAKAYVAALGGFGAIGAGSLANSGTNAQGSQWYTNGALSFNGTPIFMANGLPDDSMLATTTSNLYFGCSLLSDTQEVRTIDMSDIDGSQNVRVIMRMAAGATYGVIQDIVVYG
jgi:hypothetical protein